MAKKNAVKKPRRRLKRSVRRSLAAVLMITAIGVAAIPVPENYAAPEGRAAAVDTHTVYSYNELKTGTWDASEEAGHVGGEPIDDSAVSEGFVKEDNPTYLNKYVFKNPEATEGELQPDDEQIKKNLGEDGVISSLKIVDNGSEDELTWEYKYYASDKQIILCDYNDRYPMGTVNLAPAPNIMYFKVTSEAFNKYFEEGGTSLVNKDNGGYSKSLTMDVDPMTEVRYSYGDYKDMVNYQLTPDYKFFSNYASELFAQKTAEYKTYAEVTLPEYQRAKEAWEAENPGDYPYPEPTAPNTLETTMAGAIGTDQGSRIKFFCDNCKTLYTNGDGYTLEYVRDTTVTVQDNVAVFAYIARGGNPTGLGVKNDDDGYMVLAQGEIVSAIGAYAFKNVGNVDSIVLPTTVHYIADNAFNHCNSVVNITIDNVSTIGNNAFQNCNKLQSVSMGTGVNKIGSECFEGCSSLTSVTFSSNTTRIGDGAFANCDNVGFTTLDFNSIVEPCVIGKAAFYNCPYLSTVNMSESRVSKIGDSAFASVIGDSMTEFVFPATIEDSQDALGNRLFSGHSTLRRVVFSRNYGLLKSVTIPESMFHGCPNLEYVMFPTQKGADAYSNANLKYTTGGNTTTNELFADVTNSSFYVIGPKEKTNGDTAAPRESTWKAVTRAHDEPGYVPYCYYEGGVEYYEICSDEYLLCIRKNGDGTGTLVRCELRDPDRPPVGGKLIIPDSVGDTEVTGIDTNCFSDTNLTMSVGTVVINDHIKAIADSTFENTKIGSRKKWEKLTEVTIGSAVESIGARAFYDCDRLADITFKTPADNDYTKLKLGNDALQTNGTKLTIHGDIQVGYSPFDYAVNPSTYVLDATDGTRVCYQSRWDSPESKHMTVMYGNSTYTSAEGQTGYVTLLDYPKYSELEDPDGSAGKELRAHNEERMQQLYERYASEAYDTRRAAFALAWAKGSSGDVTKDEGGLYFNETKIDGDTGGIIDPLYGPWINEDFCNNWTKYLPDDFNEYVTARNTFDWLFEPIVVQAMSKDSHPAPYFETYSFNFMDNYKKYKGNETLIPKLSDGTVMDYLGWNDFEKGMIASVEDIVIPAGVESIDIMDFREENTKNFAIYGNDLYTNKGTDGKDKDATVVPGLFSGLIKDYGDSEEEQAEGEVYETKIRGNDRIKSVTMSTVVYLPDYAFDNCEQLDRVILGDAMEKVGALPFRDCLSLYNLTGNAKYPAENGILYETQPGEQESYKIIECLLTRGSGSPLSDMSVNSTVDPKIAFVSAIAESAFEDCNDINVVDLYAATSLEKILDGTFKDCKNLAMVTLPASVNDIQDNAFAGVCNESTLTPRCQIYVYGKEVSISDGAFGKDSDYPKLTHAKDRVKIWAYEDTAAARYAKYYSKDGNGNEGMIFEAIPASESAFSVIFMDYDGTQLGDTQWVINDYAEIPDTTELEKADHRPGYKFSGWLGTNGQDVSKKITDHCYFWAQYESDGTMVNGKYVVEFLDGVDGHQLTGLGASEEDGKYYVEAGKSFSEMGRNGWEAPARVEHPGYSFLEWSHNWTENTIINSNMTIVALYKADTTSGGSTSSGSTSTPSTTSSGGSTSNTSGSSGGSSTSSSTSSSSSSSSTSTSSTTSGSDSTAGKFTVTVINGSGSGSYDVGSTVIIAANTPAAGSVFQKWTTDSNGVALASVSLPATTFTMPANNVTVTAEYTEAAATPTSTTGGTGGTGGNTGNNNNNNNNNGSTRVDITKPGISNKDLATANVNGSTDNFVVKITETDEATRAVQEALTNKYGTLDNILYYAMDISLYDSTGTVKITDTTGITVDLTIPIPDALVAYGGNNMAGAVVNGNQLESLNESFTTINGIPCIRFTATHFSPYTIYVDTGNLTEGMLDITPKTGDPIHPKWFLSIGLACLSIILFMKKDKNVKVKTA